MQDKLKVHLSERLSTLNTDLQSMMQNINKFTAAQTSPILTNTSSSHSHEFCREFYEILYGTNIVTLILFGTLHLLYY